MIQLKQNTMNSYPIDHPTTHTDLTSHYQDCSNCQFYTKQSSGSSHSITQIGLERKLSNRSFMSIAEQPSNKHFLSKLSNANSFSQKFFELNINQSTHNFDEQAERKQEAQQNKTQSEIFSQADSFTVQNQNLDQEDDFMSQNSDQNPISLNCARSINEELHQLIKNKKVQLINPSKIDNSHSTDFDQDQVSFSCNNLFSELPKIEMENLVEEKYFQLPGTLDLIEEQSQGFGKSSMESRSRQSQLMSSFGGSKLSGCNLVSSASDRQDKHKCKLNREISTVQIDLPQEFLLMDSLKLSKKLSMAERKTQSNYQKQIIFCTTGNEVQLPQKSVLVFQKIVSAGPILKQISIQSENHLIKQSIEIQIQIKTKQETIRSIKENKTNSTKNSSIASLLGSVETIHTQDKLIFSNQSSKNLITESSQNNKLFITHAKSVNFNWQTTLNLDF